MDRNYINGRVTAKNKDHFWVSKSKPATPLKSAVTVIVTVIGEFNPTSPFSEKAKKSTKQEKVGVFRIIDTDESSEIRLA